MAEAATAPPAARRHGVNIFAEGKPMWQLLLVFLVPLMLSNVLQSASQTMAAIWIGRLISTQALAAVSAIFPIIFFLFSFLIGIASGSTILIGQAFGAGDHQRVKRIAGTAIGAALYAGILIAVVGTLVTPFLLSVLATPPDIIAQSGAYAKVVFLTMPLLCAYIVYTSVLRGTGDSATPFYVLIVSSVLTIALTPLFILGWFGLPKLGILSAAIAGFLASGIALAWMIVYLHLRKHLLRFDREMLADLRIDFSILRTIVRIGVPAGLQFVMISLAEIAVLSFVNRFGSPATAAYGAVNQVVSYVQFPAISIGISASIFGAQCIGAKREDKLGSVIRSAVTLNYCIGASIIAICYAFAWNILGWFIVDPPTLGIAHQLLMITLWGYVLFGNNAVLSGIMRGSGDVVWPTAISICAIWGIEVPAAYLLMRHFGLDGVWMGYPIAFAGGLALQFCYYEFVWKRKTHARLV
jgi:putative MATE family efflux protein